MSQSIQRSEDRGSGTAANGAIEPSDRAARARTDGPKPTSTSARGIG